jgi:hypothetical protein
MSIGVGFELGAKGGAGVTVAGSLGQGKANGSDLSWEETKINASPTDMRTAARMKSMW